LVQILIGLSLIVLANSSSKSPKEFKSFQIFLVPIQGAIKPFQSEKADMFVAVGFINKSKILGL
jgi:hypothetical protein